MPTPKGKIQWSWPLRGAQGPPISFLELVPKYLFFRDPCRSISSLLATSIKELHPYAPRHEKPNCKNTVKYFLSNKRSRAQTEACSSVTITFQGFLHTPQRSSSSPAQSQKLPHPNGKAAGKPRRALPAQRGHGLAGFAIHAASAQTPWSCTPARGGRKKRIFRKDKGCSPSRKQMHRYSPSHTHPPRKSCVVRSSAHRSRTCLPWEGVKQLRSCRPRPQQGQAPCLRSYTPFLLF